MDLYQLLMMTNARLALEIMDQDVRALFRQLPNSKTRSEPGSLANKGQILSRRCWPAWTSPRASSSSSATAATDTNTNRTGNP